VVVEAMRNYTPLLLIIGEIGNADHRAHIRRARGRLQSHSRRRSRRWLLRYKISCESVTSTAAGSSAISEPFTPMGGLEPPAVTTLASAKRHRAGPW